VDKHLIRNIIVLVTEIIAARGVDGRHKAGHDDARPGRARNGAARLRRWKASCAGQAFVRRQIMNGGSDDVTAPTEVSQEILRLCGSRIAALLQKQLLFWPRCAMSAHPQHPVV
jgi:hypothetical protein